MIVHFIRAPQFLDYTVEYFEEVNQNNNIYYFISSGTKHTLRHEITEKLTVIEPGSEKYLEILAKCHTYEWFIFHSLHNDFFPFIDRIPVDRTLCWIMFGMEVYGNFKEVRDHSLLPETRKFYRFSKNGIIDYFKPFYRKLIGRKDNENKYLHYINRFRYCAAPNPALYKILNEMGVQNLDYLKFSYYSIEQTVGDQLLNRTVNGDNIFFGNSGTFSNNHLDGLRILQKAQLNNKKIIVPLSYGDKEVIEKIAVTGKKIFGTSFVPLLEYLSREEYNQIMLSCRFVFMNHQRSQARGNILTALWIGAKVFLHESNILFHEFRSIGISIFSTNEISQDSSNALIPLSAEEIASNRTILLEYYDKENAISHAKNLVMELTNSKDSHGGNVT